MPQVNMQSCQIKLKLSIIRNMLFGDPNDFAVEIYHEPSSPSWLGFGRMRIFVQGVSIGEIEEQHCSLFHAVERIIEVAENLPTLWDARFSQHTDEEIFSWLDAILFSGEISDADEKNIHPLHCILYCDSKFASAKHLL